MANILFDDWVWSYSRLQSFEQCPWGFAQKYLYSDTKRGEPNFYSAYGSLIHELHERWYKGEIKKDQIVPEFIKRFIALPPTDSKRRTRYLAIFRYVFGRNENFSRSRCTSSRKFKKRRKNSTDTPTDNHYFGNAAILRSKGNG